MASTVTTQLWKASRSSTGSPRATFLASQSYGPREAPWAPFRVLLHTVWKVKAHRTGQISWKGRWQGGRGSDSCLVTGREGSSRQGQGLATGSPGPAQLHSRICRDPEPHHAGRGYTSHKTHSHLWPGGKARSHLKQPWASPVCQALCFVKKRTGV